MTSTRTGHRRAGLLLALGTLVLAFSGCGGGAASSRNVAQLRLLNLSSDVARVDLTLDDATVVQAAAVDALTDCVEIDPDTYDVDVLRSNGTSTLNTSSRTFSKAQHDTAVVWGRESALDVYLTRNDTTLDSTTPMASSVSSAGLSSYATADSGSWRLRMTGAGDSTDLRVVAGVKSKGSVGVSWNGRTPTGVLRKDR